MRAKTPRIESASSKQKRIEKANKSWLERDLPRKPPQYHPWKGDDKQIRRNKTLQSLEEGGDEDILN